MQMALLLRGGALGDSSFRLCSISSTSSSLHVSQNVVIPNSSSSSPILPLVCLIYAAHINLSIKKIYTICLSVCLNIYLSISICVYICMYMRPRARFVQWIRTELHLYRSLCRSIFCFFSCVADCK